MKTLDAVPFREVALGPTEVERSDLPDGSILLTSRDPLRPYPERITEKLCHWAEHAPERTFLARRADVGRWEHVSYKTALGSVQSLGQALLNRGLHKERPLAILSGNSLEHALLGLAALHVGIPYAPISPPYSLLSSDFNKLRHCLELLTPGLIFVSDGKAYARALEAVLPDLPETELVVGQNPPEGVKATLYRDLLETLSTGEVERAFERVTADTVAKILFTSGSTGVPKGVINTQRMWCANQQQILQALPFLAEEPPQLVDWLPWNHTFGGNHNVGITLYNGGSLFIDDGKPSPAGMQATVDSLKDISPTVYFNVPKGYENLLPYFERDDQLRETFFGRLKLLFYAGAGLAQPVWDALEQLAAETVGERVPILTGLGMTESGPSALFANWPGGFSGLLGTPVAGIILKLVPNGGKLELRYKGPNITPGYWRQPELSAKAFDDEGFLLTGDALTFVDEAEPSRGMLFDGRVSEDFKLTTGTWVNAGIMRMKLNAKGAPLIQDAVITGRDRNYVGALLFLNLAECIKRVPDHDALSDEDVLEHPLIRAALKAVLVDLQNESTGSSNRFERFLVVTEAPSLERGEVTDKGSLNQRRILELRADLVAELYQASASERVITGGLT